MKRKTRKQIVKSLLSAANVLQGSVRVSATRDNEIKRALTDAQRTNGYVAEINDEGGSGGVYLAIRKNQVRDLKSLINPVDYGFSGGADVFEVNGRTPGYATTIYVYDNSEEADDIEMGYAEPIKTAYLDIE